MRISAFLENIGQAARDAGVPMQSFLAQLKQEGLESVYAGYPTSLKPMRQMVLGLLKAFGLPMEGVWGTVDFLSMTDEEATEEYKAMIDCAAENGAKHVLITPGLFHAPGSGEQTSLEEIKDRESDIRRMIRLMGEAKAYGESVGVAVTMEDYDWFTSPIAYPEVLRRFFEEIPGLKCSFDTGNFIPCDADVMEEFAYYKDKIVALHLKDRAENDDQGGREKNAYVTQSGRRYYPAVVGSGDMHIPEIIAELNRSGYTGCGIIELFSSTDMANKLVESIRWLKKNRDMT
ncbi:MAG: sugar phosphate isomerase/epimerase [Oscillospiraceae bacterium]|nr:sugar phosphate isomerase/epimerase [Oscillospiraceae bacterium]